MAKHVRDNLTEKLPPHDLDAERAVLGFVLLDHRFMGPLLDRLVANDLYLDTHKTIFRAVAECRRRGRPSDAIGVQDALRFHDAATPEKHTGSLADLLQA